MLNAWRAVCVVALLSLTVIGTCFFYSASLSGDVVQARRALSAIIGPDLQAAVSNQTMASPLAEPRRGCSKGFNTTDDFGEQGMWCIPLVATNVEYDHIFDKTGQGFLTRLVDSWADYPAIGHKLIVTGGSYELVMQQVANLSSRYKDLTVQRLEGNIGCAGGWNAILQYMKAHQLPWGIILNNDVYVPPGALRKLSEEIWAYLSREPKACQCFFKVIIGGMDFTAFVQTQYATEVLGEFDANIWPAYFEDNDMAIRQEAATRDGICASKHYFKSANLEHGPGGPYRSGTLRTQEKLKKGKKTKHEGDKLTMRINRGWKSSEAYLLRKWNYRYAQKHNASHLYKRPFNKKELPLGFWEMDTERRRCIADAPPTVKVC